MIQNRKDKMVEVEISQDEVRFEPSERRLKCGHICRGVKHESEKLPCLNVQCIESSNIQISCAENELCCICYSSELGEEPCVRIACGHVFHANCLYMMLKHGRTSKKITFGYLDCPSCK